MEDIGCLVCRFLCGFSKHEINSSNFELSRYGTNYTIWLVTLIVFNFLWWMSMKQPYFIILLIPCPTSPGKDIDVYLRSLIYELKDLWMDGINMCNVYTATTFCMRAALLWTVSNFPTYVMFPGLSTRGLTASFHIKVVLFIWAVDFFYQLIIDLEAWKSFRW